MVLFELFWSFCQIGFTSFGGISMVPTISHEMLSHGWMTATEVSDIVAIAEMTPGPLGMNCATFAGTRVAGLLGALAAGLGVVSPTLIVGTVVAFTFEKFKDAAFMRKIMRGVRPACLGMIVSVLCSLAATNYLNSSGVFSPAAALIGLAAALALLKWKVSIPKTLLLAALLGMLLIR